MDKRFKIEFGGKSYPEYRPAVMKMRAPSEERAKEWAERQLKAWGIEASTVKVKIEAIAEDPSDDEVEKQAKKEAKKKKKQAKTEVGE
jgi:hypothetical protein